MPGILGLVDTRRPTVSLGPALLSLCHLPSHVSRELDVSAGIALGEVLARDPHPDLGPSWAEDVSVKDLLQFFCGVEGFFCNSWYDIVVHGFQVGNQRLEAS